MTPTRRRGISIAAILALALVGAAPAEAATHIWIGPTNGTWSTSSNWSGGSKPTSGEAGGTIVQFGANTTSSMDIAGLVVDQIHFTGANNTINGTTPLTINGNNLLQNIVSEAGGNTLGGTLHIAMLGPAAVEAASSSGTLTIAGPVSGPAVGLVFAGTGGEFALTANNTYTGPTTIASGSLHIGTPAGLVIVGSAITVGNGVGSGAQLVLDQSSDISPETAVTVNSDGVFNFQTFSDVAKSLTVNGGQVLSASLAMTGPLVMKDGTITIGGTLSAGSLNMTGGTISGPGLLALSGNVQATSSASGPATVASGVRLAASPTVTVTPGAAPELGLTGVISETGGARSITKAGGGTMLMSAANTYTGTTTVSAGTLLANGTQTGAVSVGPGGTLGGSGTVGATSIEGVLAPTAAGLHTGSLSFGPTGSLDATLTSVAPAAMPSTMVTGTVTIDPNAALNVAVAPGTAVPRGSNLLLIGNDGPDAIGGQFAGVPTNSVLTTVEGVPLTVNYAGGDGNDLVLTAASLPPQISPVSAPTSAGTGTPKPTPSMAAANTTTGRSAGFGADFGLTVPGACLRRGTPIMVTMTVTRRIKARGNVIAKVTKVVFAIDGKTVKTVRVAPFRARLSVTRSARSGSTIELRAKAYLSLRSGRRGAKSITVPVKVC